MRPCRSAASLGSISKRTRRGRFALPHLLVGSLKACNVELIRDSDPRRVKAVMGAMMTMVKLDVAGLERAYHEVG